MRGLYTKQKRPIACSVAASYASAGASPTVGSPSVHRALLGLRRLYAGGAKTLELQRPCCGSVFFRRKAAEDEMNGLGHIARTTVVTNAAADHDSKS